MHAEAPWPDDPNIVRLAHRADRCTVLGPGCRAVLWVQGCPFRCPGCIAPQTQPFRGGESVPVEELASHLIGLPDIEGVTISGGEPMCQAGPLANLIGRVRSDRDLSFLCYTGYELEWLRRSGSQAQKELLRLLDILIDGPYVADRHTDLRWRGSDNQRVHVLSERHADIRPSAAESGVHIEFSLGADGTVYWMGIPPPGFRDRLPAALENMGITLKEESSNEWFA